MENITAVGIDVSKGKSTIAVMRAGGEVVVSPYNIGHSADELNRLVVALKFLGGDIRIVMEHTGAYYLPVANILGDAGFFVSVVHAKLVHDFGNNSIRRGKTDPKDAIKIANYTLANWTSLVQFQKQNDVRQELKKLNRQLHLYTKIETSMKNNLIALLDHTFPNVNKLFPPIQKTNGHENRVVSMILINQREDDELFQFICKKRSEGKHYYVYMTAASNKFLRQYYGKVRDCLLELSNTTELKNLLPTPVIYDTSTI